MEGWTHMYTHNNYMQNIKLFVQGNTGGLIGAHAI